MLVLLVTLSILCSFIFSWLNLKKYCFLVRRSYYWLLSVIILFFFWKFVGNLCFESLLWRLLSLRTSYMQCGHLTHWITSLNLEFVRFLIQIFKTFNITWLEGHLQKLRSLGLCGKYLYRGTIKKGVLISQPSNLSAIKTCIPQGLMSGPSFFLVCINDTPNELT